MNNGLNISHAYGKCLRRSCLSRGFKSPSKLTYIVIPEPKKKNLMLCYNISLLIIKYEAHRARLPKTGKISGNTSHTWHKVSDPCSHYIHLHKQINDGFYYRRAMSQLQRFQHRQSKCTTTANTDISNSGEWRHSLSAAVIWIAVLSDCWQQWNRRRSFLSRLLTSHPPYYFVYLNFLRILMMYDYQSWHTPPHLLLLHFTYCVVLLQYAKVLVIPPAASVLMEPFKQ